jgi:hypothetical protein
MRHTFNFRDVAKRLNIPLTNENDWAMGQILKSSANKRGHQVERVLADKTDPNPRVSAQHCIAHYPIEFWDDAIDAVRNWWGEKESQMEFDL